MLLQTPSLSTFLPSFEAFPTVYRELCSYSCSGSRSATTLPDKMTKLSELLISCSSFCPSPHGILRFSGTIVPPLKKLEVFALSAGAGKFPVISWMSYQHPLGSPPGFPCGISQLSVALVTALLNHHIDLPSPASTFFPTQTEATETHLPSKDQEWGTLCSGKTGRTGLQIDIFRRNFQEPGFLHFPILRKALKR